MLNLLCWRTKTKSYTDCWNYNLFEKDTSSSWNMSLYHSLLHHKQLKCVKPLEIYLTRRLKRGEAVYKTLGWLKFSNREIKKGGKLVTGKPTRGLCISKVQRSVMAILRVMFCEGLVQSSQWCNDGPYSLSTSKSCERPARPEHLS